MKQNDSLIAIMYPMKYLCGGLYLSTTKDQTVNSKVKVTSRAKANKTNKIVLHPALFDEMHNYKR
ncbi:hypothetical protein [Oceanobacillus kapialis]|uniref:Uncharacterized protein n=1 Tax=Oceanobacillus kapialis TaxID=481353 RepID=A0ABW5PZV0_9BACI